MNRTVIRIAGETGYGLSGVGEIIQKALKKYGFQLRSEREFPSTIKGGLASNNINFSDTKIHGLSNHYAIGLGLDREGVKDLLETLVDGGILIHAFDRWNKVIKDLPARAEAKNLQVFLIPARDIAIDAGGSLIMVNTVLTGFLWKILGLGLEILQKEIANQFTKKPQFIEVNQKCCEAGYNYTCDFDNIPNLDILKPTAVSEKENPDILIDGNTAIGLGAIRGGVRAYYAYPMSPSTSILVYLASVSHETKMLVKQAEDEITAVQMAIGSMHAGTRALVATSGGGFDLMTESISLSGMIETPLVIVIAQRPGPATGLPTWTGQGDVNLAIHAGHGEFPKVVLASSDPESCFILTQKALNFAEVYQIPVVLLTEATIGMSLETTESFADIDIPIERGIHIPSSDEKLEQRGRYAITGSGVSKRWLPGSSETVYFANGDEHWEGGELTEDADKAEAMISKRLRKLDTILQTLPDAELFGDETATVTLVGFGSTKKPILDAIEILNSENIKINYLHYEFLHPLKTEKLEALFKSNNKVFLVEGNHKGQFGQILEAKTGLKFADKYLKWNGRPFFVEDILEFVRGKI